VKVNAKHCAKAFNRNLTLELTRRETPPKPSKFSMRGKLIPVGSNELLDFVRRNLSAFPDPALSILAFNAPDAAWRSNLPHHQLALSARGSQHSTFTSTPESSALLKLKIADSVR
jgi:hypothetical protein